MKSICEKNKEQDIKSTCEKSRDQEAISVRRKKTMRLNP
jgi:hypothetical protein